MTTGNVLYYGDNLDVLRRYVPDESVDLIYLDPPFNSNASYNVLFKAPSGEKAAAQIQAFDDTWHWSHQADEAYQELVTGRTSVAIAKHMTAMRNVLGPSDMLAYLVMMAPRLVELRRVLKPTGSLYLHCDPTASHYLKLLLDAVFGSERFINEVIWKRTFAHNRTVRYGPVHDVLLFYSKGADWFWREQYVPYDDTYIENFYHHVEPGTNRRYMLDNVTSNRPGGRFLWNGKPPPGKRFWGYGEAKMKEFEAEGRLIYSKNGIPRYKRYLDEMPGQLLQDVWVDIPPISSHSSERLGYPTQKPLALLERIIVASCPEDGVVLDPFCGCGTAIDAAEHLDRRWVGIDLTYIAIDLIIKRLRHRYGPDFRSTFTTNGIPEDVQGAQALFARNPFDFERWAVSLVGGEPNQKQVGDQGIDGRIRFDAGAGEVGVAAVSVKGGQQINPSMVQSLVGAMQQEHADMAVLVTMRNPTPGMKQAAEVSGIYRHDISSNTYPKVQIITVAELLKGQRLEMPMVFLPYIKATARAASEAQSLW